MTTKLVEVDDEVYNKIMYKISRMGSTFSETIDMLANHYQSFLESNLEEGETLEDIHKKGKL